MKSLAISTILLCFLTFAAQAQVLETTKSMSAGSQPALTILLPDADIKMVDATWKEYMKSYGKLTKVKGSKENVASQVQILDIAGINRLNVYSLSEAASGGVNMVVWFDTGSGYINSQTNPKEYVGAVKFMKDFAHQVKLGQIAAELEAQKKVVAKAESNLEKLKKENDNLHKIIEDSKKRIAQAEKDIETNLKDQETAQKEIGAQSEALRTVEKKLEDAKKEQ